MTCKLGLQAPCSLETPQVAGVDLYMYIVSICAAPTVRRVPNGPRKLLDESLCDFIANVSLTEPLVGASGPSNRYYKPV